MEQIEEKLPPPAPEPQAIEEPQPQPRKPHSRLRLLLASALLLLLLIGLLLFGFSRHRSQQKAAEAAAQRQRESIPQIDVARVIRSARTAELQLPGNITPITEAYLYARATGYVRSRYADIGDRVRAGQVLAVIAAPDLDEQVRQARAALTQAEHQTVQAEGALRDANARLELARVTWDRYRVLNVHGAVSRQDADQQYQAFRSAQAVVTESEANVRAAEQNVRGNKANLGRLLVLQGFEELRAPFSGIITARNFDVGALVSSEGASLGSSSTPMGGTQQVSQQAVAGPTGTTQTNISPTSPTAGAQGGQLFRMAQIQVLRVLINVPEEAVPSIRVGGPATVFVQAFSNRPFPGRVTRTSSSVDIVSRTMLAEVQVRNPDLVLLPGMFVEVQLASVRRTPPLLIPGDALITNANGLQVALVQPIRDPARTGAHSGTALARIHIQNVQVGRDYGMSVEIISGLEEGEYVAVNPSDVVREGATVQPRVAPSLPGENTQPTLTIGGEQPGGISRPSETAPTRAPQVSGGRDGQGGKKQ